MTYWRRIGARIWDVLVSVDQFGNVLIGLGAALLGWQNEYGSPDETISSVLGRRTQANRTNALERALVWTLDQIDADHVIEAIEAKVPERHRLLSAPRRAHVEE